MKYHDKSFSVSMGSDKYAENFDRVFGKKKEEAAPVVDLSERQCAACLEKGSLEQVADGLLQCGICQARFPIGIEQAQKVTGPGACPNCDGTGRLRTTFTVFGCGECGATGARKP